MVDPLTPSNERAGTLKLSLIGWQEKSTSILHELDLGRHTLLLMSDGSIDLLVNDEQTPSLADNGLHLDSDETYRLLISLQEQYKQQDVCQ